MLGLVGAVAVIVVGHGAKGVVDGEVQQGKGAQACQFSADPPSVERFGGDYQFVPLVRGVNATMAQCAALCCADGRCRAVSFNDPEPGSPPGCVRGGTCCHLKDTVPRLRPNTYGPAVATAVVNQTRPPPVYPVPPGNPSKLISHCDINETTTVATGVQGDTWPSTWTSDGSSFAMGCDNRPPGLPNAFMNWWSTSPDPLSLRLVNDAPVSDVDVLRICGRYFANDTSQGNIKPSSVIALNNTLYAAVQCISYDDGANTSFSGRQRAWNAWIIASTDGGQTWNVSATSTDMFQGVLTNPVFIQAGPGHSQAPDSFIYVHFPGAAVPATAYWDGNEFILLGRVPTNAILDRSAYQFWIGSSWSSEAALASPVFEYPFMVGQDHTFYSPQLKRYFLPNYGFMDWDSGAPVSWHGYTRREKRPPTSQLTLYEAAGPEGPWDLVHIEQPWNLGGHGAYCPDFPARWVSADGLHLKMVASACCGQPEYSFHQTDVRFTLATQLGQEVNHLKVP